MHTKLSFFFIVKYKKNGFSHFLLSQEARKNNNDKDYSINVLDIDKEGHAILLKDVKRKDSTQQVLFTGVPFIILGMKRLECAHVVSRCTSTKKKD